MSDTKSKLSTFKLACIMCGLPARGKTYMARKIVRYLDWLGYPTRIFNVGNYRRDFVGAFQPHSFFDASNEESSHKRMEVAMAALEDMFTWFDTQEKECNEALVNNSPVLSASNAIPDFQRFPSDSSISTTTSSRHGEFRAGGHGFIALYDATNSTVERRKVITEKCEEKGVQVMFIESICTDDKLIMANIKEVKLSSPDYANVDPEKAVKDFMERIRHYEKVYETLSISEEVPYIKLINVGSHVQMFKIKGYIQSKIVYFLINLNVTPRHIYFTRHGESEYNVLGKIGGDSNLSERGKEFSKQLPELFSKKLEETNEKATIWTSTLKRTIQTAAYLPYPKMQWRQLDELDSGVCDAMTYEEIEAAFPEDFNDRDLDKYHYRYKGGESYRDLVQRLEPVIMELERHSDPNHSILIVGHQAVLRCIYAYFLNYSHSELPYLKIPLHTLIKLSPRAYGCHEERFALNIPAVSTHRPRREGGRSASPVRSDIPEGLA